MGKKIKAQSKLLLEILPDSVSPEDIPEIFPRSKFQYFKKNSIKTAFIVSSELVDSQIYHAIVGVFNNNGLAVLGFYLDSFDESRFDTLRGAVQDLKKSLARGGCMVISYKSKHALSFIASLYVYNGKAPDEAAAHVRKIKRDDSGIDVNKNFLHKFHEYVTHSGGAKNIIPNAIQIDTSAERPQAKEMLR